MDPDKIGVAAELVRYPNANGKMLCGLYFESIGAPRGTVVHFHGNAHNVSDHFPLALFLRKHGWDVLCFDYQGFGASEGKPSPARAVEDGLASVRYARAHMRANPGGVMIFAQSVGVPPAVAVAAQDPGIKALVLEGGFYSYRAAMHRVMRRSWILWPFSWVIPPLVVRRTWDADRWIERMSPRPVLFIHGTGDRVVPYDLTEKLFRKAKEPKELWLVPGADHLQCRRHRDYESKVANFFAGALEYPPEPASHQ